MKSPRLWALSLVALGACQTNYSVDPEGYACDLGEVCPEGYHCRDGVCRKAPDTLEDLCQNVSCVAPPSPSCVNSSTLRTYAANGTCSAGSCQYPHTDVTCAMACAQDRCVNQDLCQGVTCNAAPGPTCVGNTLRTFAQTGVCDPGNGMCTYPSTDTACPGGCAGNQCVPTPLSFNPVDPPVPFLVRAVDQAPGSQGKHALVVGDGGKVAKWNGSTWSPLNSGTGEDLLDVWFAAEDEAWLVGKASTVLRYDGSSISRPTIPALSGSAFNFVAVHGRSKTHVLVGAEDGTYLRFDGSTWTQGTLPAASGPYALRDAYVSSNGNERLVGACNASSCVAHAATFGANWEVRTTNGSGLQAVGPAAGSNPSEALVGRMDNQTVVRQLANLAFSTQQVPTNLEGRGIRGITPAAQGVYVLTGAGMQNNNTIPSRLYRYTTNGFNPNGPLQLFRLGAPAGGQQALGPTDSDGILVADSSAQVATVVRVSPNSIEPLSLGEPWVAASPLPGGGLVVMSASGDLLYRPPGAAPKFQRSTGTTGARLRDVAAGSGLVLAVGDNGQAYRVDTNFSGLNTATTGDFFAVCRVSDSEFYFVGEGGRIRSYDGNALTTYSSPVNGDLYDVFCVAPGEAIACGEEGKVLELKGGNWVEVAPAFPNDKDLTSCLKAPDGSLYVAGNGAFHRLHNGAWDALPQANGLTHLQYLSATELYAVAEGNKVVRFDGNQWTTQATAGAALRGGTRSANGAWFVGDNGVLLEGK